MDKQDMQHKHWGANKKDWDHFDVVCGLGEDLLPVVSNLNAEILGTSQLKAIGKVPSCYYGKKVGGIKNWTEQKSTSNDIKKWKQEADYGICIQTRNLRALDVDIDDREKALSVEVFVRELFESWGISNIPMRVRCNSGKFLIAFYVKEAGALAKRIIRTNDDSGILEFLADGQQFIACGTHSSGKRYGWRDLEGDFPTITLDQMEELWAALKTTFGSHDDNIKESLPRRRGEDLGLYDPLTDQLEALGVGPDGQVYITCPWKDEHTMDSGITETCYFPAGTNGYQRGHFKCLHAHCEHRTDADFIEALGVGPMVVKDARNHVKLAEAFLKRKFDPAKGKSLVCHRSIFYSFTGTHYVCVDKEQLSAMVWKCLGDAISVNKDGEVKDVCPTKNMVASVLDALKAITLLSDQDAPFWIAGKHKCAAGEYLSMANGLLHLPTRTLSEHTYQLFTPHILPFPWEPEAKMRDFQAFLDSVWPNDTESQRTIAEVFGYILTNDTSLQKMFLLVGPKRSGKGTLAYVLEGILGGESVVTPTLQSLTSNFGLWPLIDKALVLIPDARLGRSDRKQVIVERLLNISGEDSLTVDRKHEKPWVGRLPGRVFIMTNELPMLGDASGALTSRFIVMVMKKSFLGQEDVGLKERLLSEFPAIFRWALDGYERLCHRGRFLTPSVSQDALKELADLNNPVEAFVREYCVLGSAFSLPTSDFRAGLNRWRGMEDLHSIGGEAAGLALRSAFPQINKKRPGCDGAREYCYEGIKLNKKGEKLIWGELTSGVSEGFGVIK